MTEQKGNEINDYNDSDEKRVSLLGSFRSDTSEHINFIQEMRTHKHSGINRFLSIVFWIGAIIIFMHIVLRFMT